MPPSWFSVFRDATIVALVSAGVAVGANALRATGSIPLVAKQEYEILVPCPEFEGKPAAAIAPEKVRAEGTLLVDAREREDYDAWHLPGAVSIPYDYLEPKPEEKKVLRTHARKVVVYGDGDEPDSGRQLANAISSKGVKNVFYVVGGAPALRKRGGK